MEKSKNIKKILRVRDTEIAVLSTGSDDDYISLTDIARYKNPTEPNIVVSNWLRRMDTIEFLGLWETLYNPNFKPIEFGGFKKNAGANAFTLSPQRWIISTEVINAKLIRDGIGITERMAQLRVTAIQHLKSLTNSPT